MVSDWDLNSYLKVLRRWWWLLLAAALLALGASYVGSKAMRPTYRTAVIMIVGEDASNPRVRQEDVLTSVRLAGTYASSATRQPVLQAVVQSLGLNMDWRELQENVLPVRIEGTQLIEVRVSDSDPQRAAAIANEIARQMLLQSPTMQNMQELAERREFARTQLDTLQANIDSAELAVRERKQALEREQSARAVMDLKDEIRALELKITDWRTAFATLTASFPTRGPNTITVLETAAIPTRPLSPNIPANMGLATVVALLLSMTVVFVVESMNRSKVAADPEVGLDLPLPQLGSIRHLGKIGGDASKALVALSAPDGPAAEDYRLVRTNLQFTWGTRGKMMLLVTSPSTGEGKSTLSANLAVSFAQAGKPTILVDADLRRSAQATLFGIDADRGLTTLLRRESSDGRPSPITAAHVAECLRPTAVPNLRVLPAGTIDPAESLELLASPRMEKLIEHLRTLDSVVIVDGPPILPTADASILASMGLGVVFVAEARRTTRQAAREAHEMLGRVKARVLGIVINKAKKSANVEYYARTDRPVPARRRTLFGLSRGA